MQGHAPGLAQCGKDDASRETAGTDAHPTPISPARTAREDGCESVTGVGHLDQRPAGIFH